MDVSRIQSASSSSNSDVFFEGMGVWMHCCKRFNIEGRSGVNDVAARRALVQVSDHDWNFNLYPFIEKRGSTLGLLCWKSVRLPQGEERASLSRIGLRRNALKSLKHFSRRGAFPPRI